MEKEEKPSQETLLQWHNDPANWKWGVFYYNKKDKRILPPKRTKSLGWTINFANPFSIITLIGFAIFIALLVFYIKKQTR